MAEEKLSPELQDLAEMEGAAMCRQIQRVASTTARLMIQRSVELAIELTKDPDRLEEYIKKFKLEE
jgi:hypothetical protein